MEFAKDYSLNTRVGEAGRVFILITIPALNPSYHPIKFLNEPDTREHALANLQVVRHCSLLLPKDDALSLFLQPLLS